MALIVCDECGSKISSKAVACPHCGAPNEAEASKRQLPTKTTTRRKGGVFEGVGFVMILAGIWLAVTGGGQGAALLIGLAGFVVFLIGRFM